MTHDVTHNLKDWWELLLQKREMLEADPRLPMWNLGQWLDRYHLPELPSTAQAADRSLKIGDAVPAFKTLSDSILLALRTNLDAKANLDTVGAWAEKLMRFCEIRYRSLKKRAIEKCKNLAAARSLLLHLMVFFLDYGQSKNDLRFFNIVLKLADLPWLVNPGKISSLLGQENESVVYAAFQVRILLIKASLLDNLHKETTA